MKQPHGKTAARMLALFAIAFFVAGTSSAVRSQTFDGVVEFTVTSEEGTMPMTYMEKGNNVRIEMEGRPGMKAAILINVKDKKATMLMEKMKMYMPIPEPKASETSGPKPEITKTGKTQEILGYKCEQVIIKYGERQTEVWITKDLGPFAMFQMGPPGKASREEEWQKVIGKEGGFPLKAVTTLGDKKVNEMTATKVEKKSLDNALFQIPEGYKQFDPSMMGGPRQ
jgi:Domain of unknown function (DUF4412)